jgi:hypothetical protein
LGIEAIEKALALKKWERSELGRAWSGFAPDDDINVPLVQDAPSRRKTRSTPTPVAATRLGAAPGLSAPTITAPVMHSDKHVFISYVHEDAAEVDRLENDLLAAALRVWRDLRNIWPGDDWQREIRRAIEHDSCAFIACFSNNSRARPVTYLWEEMTLAAECFRMRPPGRAWMYPVRFDDGPVLDFPLGAGRTLEICIGQTFSDRIGTITWLV